jgi:peptidoglycan/xylan/chitin deacetylase (PgdA/CDA1 family)
MSTSCPGLLRFWGLGRGEAGARPADGIVIEAGARTRGRVVFLELDETLRPPWLASGERVALWSDRRLGRDVEGRALAWLMDGTERLPAIVETAGSIVLRFDPEQTAAAILDERYFTPRRPLHTYLRLPYHFVPGRARLWLFRRMTRAVGSRSPEAPFPEWPVASSVEALRWAFLCCWRRAGGEGVTQSHWPQGKRYAFAVSHDVDTAAGLRRIPEIAAIEAQHGLTATWFLLGDRYRIDDSLLDRLRQQGHEIGLHGDRHDNRIAYLRRQAIAARLSRCSGLVTRHGVCGFRAPSLLETPLLREVLATSFRYASQTPDTEVDALVAPRRGCATCFPFVKQGLLEIPITLPMEDKLLIAGLDEAQILALWRRKLAWVREVGGIAQLVVHSEPHLFDHCRRAFQAILKDVAEDGAVWRATLGDVARWWQESKLDG